MTYYICILDFETTYWANDTNDEMREIIEFPSLLYKVDGNNKITQVSEFQQYVKPIINPNLSDFCIEQTKITQEMIDKADTFDIVYNQHIEWITKYVSKYEKLVFVTCGKWDLGTMLPIEIKRHNLQLCDYYTKFADIRTDFSKIFNVGCAELYNILKKLKIEQINKGQQYSGINNCKNLAKIVIRMVEAKHVFR